MMSELMAWAAGGAQGIPIPYSPRMDDGITVILLCCFFLSAYVLSRSRRFLLQLVKDFLLHRERTSIFATSTAGDMRYLLLLILQTCILAGVCIFNYCNDVQPELVRHVSPFMLLGIYIGVSFCYLLFKWVLYSVLGWIFFDESVTTLWLESYSTLLYYLGFTLFPFALFIVYFDLSLQLTIIIGLILAFFTKILMLYKWLKASEKSPYYDIAEKYGVKIDFRPFIKVESLSAKEFRQQKVSILDHTAVIFTSCHAIDHFFHLCTELRVTIPETMKYFCVTEAIALYIQKYVQYRKRKIFFGNTGKFDDLLPSIVKHKTEKYLVPMSDVHTEEIKNLLDKSKIQHTEVVMYRTVSNDFTPDEKFDYDMLVFFSPAGVSSLKKNFPDFEQKEIKIGTFGSTTAQAVRDAGLRLDLEAPSVQAPSMTAALDMFIKENNKGK